MKSNASDGFVADNLSGQQTAKKAAAILTSVSGAGYVLPTARQKQNLVVAFAKLGKIIYGKAFDVVKIKPGSNFSLDELDDVEVNLHRITLVEIKSTRKKVGEDFSKFFFALTGAEVLVAQSLKSQFHFVLVDTTTGKHLEISLGEIFGRAKGIYPTWSISF